jgi:hypothetical protein
VSFISEVCSDPHNNYPGHFLITDSAEQEEEREFRSREEWVLVGKFMMIRSQLLVE